MEEMSVGDGVDCIAPAPLTPTIAISSTSRPHRMRSDVWRKLVELRTDVRGVCKVQPEAISYTLEPAASHWVAVSAETHYTNWVWSAAERERERERDVVVIPTPRHRPVRNVRYDTYTSSNFRLQVRPPVDRQRYSYRISRACRQPYITASGRLRRAITPYDFRFDQHADGSCSSDECSL